MNMLELNYRYGTGFIKLDDLVKEWKQERNDLYNILNMKPRLFLLRGEK